MWGAVDCTYVSETLQLLFLNREKQKSESSYYTSFVNIFLLLQRDAHKVKLIDQLIDWLELAFLLLQLLSNENKDFCGRSTLN